jgi:hypothetical protein
MKTFKFTVALLTLIIATGGCDRQKRPAKPISWIGFQWEGDSIGNRYFDKLAMFVPFGIDGIPYQFSSQFDLGAPVSMVYGNSFSPLLKEFPEISRKLDTVNKNHVIQGMRTGEIKDISFYLDTVKFTHQHLAFFKGFGEKYSIDDFRKKRLLHIGTIGSNLFKEKVLVIDFKNHRLAVLDSISNKTEKGAVNIETENGRIKIPVIIDGKKVYVIYDTGSSFATLFLSSYNWNTFRDTTSTLDTITASAWGVEYPILISKTGITINIGDNTFKPETVTANTLKPYYDFYKKEKIIGLMGNKLFYDKTVIIDFKNKKFGIINDFERD